MQIEELDAVNNPEDPGMGTRKVPFSRVLYIERMTSVENPPKQFYRLAPGREVRLRYAYFITCIGVVKDEKTGEVLEVRCTYDPATRGGDAPDGRKVKSTLHWVSAAHALEKEVRLYDHLFTSPTRDVGEGADWKSNINPDSLSILKSCRVEQGLSGSTPGSGSSLNGRGISVLILIPSPEKLVFNRIVTLRDTWAKIEKSQKEGTMSYITVIGAGSWGTTLAYLLSEKGFDVALWVLRKRPCRRDMTDTNQQHLSARRSHPRLPQDYRQFQRRQCKKHDIS